MRIAEIFASLQGEGILTGVPSVFVRTSGCNLRCWFCDTPYASWQPEGNNFSVEQIIERVLDLEHAHVVLTGGEPMIAPGIEQLVNELHQHARHITIETAATVLPQNELHCDLMSISPKLSNSAPDPNSEPKWYARHELTRHRPSIVDELIQSAQDYQLKFVVGSILDAEEVLEYLSLLKNAAREKIFLMPRGTSHDDLTWQLSWLQEWCVQHNLQFCDRMQIHWFGNVRGT